MAEIARLSERVEHDLQYGQAMIDELDENDREWDELNELDWTYWSLDWDQFMGILVERLQQAHDRGAMTPEQAAAYDDLLRRLRERLPVILRQRLWVPPLLQQA